MALSAQKSVIRRASSVKSTAGTTLGLNIITGTTDKICSTVVGQNFTATPTSFTVNQRLVISGSTTNITVYTLKTLAATIMETYELTLVSENSTKLNITGYTMIDIGEVVGWTGPNETAAVMDVTHLGSTVKEKMISVRDSGQVSLDIFFNEDSTQHQRLRKDMQNRTLRQFDIVFNDSASQPSYFFFEAYVTGFSVQGSVDNPIKGSVTLDISGPVNYSTRN